MLSLSIIPTSLCNATASFPASQAVIAVWVAGTPGGPLCENIVAFNRQIAVYNICRAAGE